MVGSGIYRSIETKFGRLAVVDNYQILSHGGGSLSGPEGVGGGLWGWVQGLRVCGARTDDLRE